MLTQFHHKTTARYYYPAGMLVKKKKMNRTEEDDSRALSIYGSRVAIDLPYTCQCARTWPPPSMKWNRSRLHVSWGEKSYTPSMKKTRNDVFINNEIRTNKEWCIYKQRNTDWCWKIRSPSFYNFLCLILNYKKEKKVSLCQGLWILQQWWILGFFQNVRGVSKRGGCWG